MPSESFDARVQATVTLSDLDFLQLIDTLEDVRAAQRFGDWQADLTGLIRRLHRGLDAARAGKPAADESLLMFEHAEVGGMLLEVTSAAPADVAPTDTVTRRRWAPVTADGDAW